MMEFSVGLSGTYRCNCGAAMLTLKLANNYGNIIHEIPLLCENKRHVRLSWLCAAKRLLSKYVKDAVKREELFAALLAYFNDEETNWNEIWHWNLHELDIAVSLRKESKKRT